jgi:hypothetical protein
VSFISGSRPCVPYIQVLSLCPIYPGPDSVSHISRSWLCVPYIQVLHDSSSARRSTASRACAVGPPPRDPPGSLGTRLRVYPNPCSSSVITTIHTLKVVCVFHHRVVVIHYRCGGSDSERVHPKPKRRKKTATKRKTF